METLDGVVQWTVGRATDFVARHERDVDVKRGVFDALRARRSAHLLQPLREREPWVGLGGVRRAEQHVGDECP